MSSLDEETNESITGRKLFQTIPGNVVVSQRVVVNQVKKKKVSSTQKERITEQQIWKSFIPRQITQNPLSLLNQHHIWLSYRY